MIPRACIRCGRTSIPGTSRCPEHSLKSGWTAYKRRHPERAAFYQGTYWKQRRERHLIANPQCVVCGQPATHVDHVTPMAEGGDPQGPVQSLCDLHHRQKTTREGHRGMKRKAARKKAGS